jgi:hypothetical protein
VTLVGILDSVLHWIDRLYTRLGTTSSYNVTTNLHTSQIITTPTKPFPPCRVFTNRSLVTAYNSEDSSASALKSFLYRLLYRTDSVAPAFFLITPRYGPRSQHIVHYHIITISAGTCSPSRSLSAAVYSYLLRIWWLSTDVIPLYVLWPMPRNERCFRAVRYQRLFLWLHDSCKYSTKFISVWRKLRNDHGKIISKNISGRTRVFALGVQSQRARYLRSTVLTIVW